MMKRLILFALISLGLAAASPPSAPARQKAEDRKPKKLDYSLEPIPAEDGLRFLIELRFTGDQTGKTQLLLPSEWAGETRLYGSIKNLKVLSAGATLTDAAEPHIKLITHKPASELRVSYELAGQQMEAPTEAPTAERRASYRPVLQKNYFHLIGSAAFVRPAWNDTEEIAISLQWKNLPREWTLANSFGANEPVQHFKTNIRDLISSVLVGGDFRLRSIRISGKPVYIAARGSWRFTDEEFASLVEKIFAIERGFWYDYDYPYYLVTLLPVEAQPATTFSSGTGLTTSFATLATTNVNLDDLKFVIAHALFHNWNTRKLGTPKQAEQLLYWFSEGFTNYYTYLLLARGGLISYDDYVGKYNEALRAYYTSPVRNATNERVLKEFFTNDEIGKLAYWRGMLVAANWNVQIRIATQNKNSLDDVMRDMFSAARKEPGRVLSEAVIGEHIRRYTGQDVQTDIDRFITRGELILPNNYALSACARQTIAGVAGFELGFDLEALRTKKIISALKPESAAYRAGLREGQTVVRRSPIYPGDPNKEVEITVKDGEREKTIKFFPASPGHLRVPQFVVRKDIPENLKSQCL